MRKSNHARRPATGDRTDWTLAASVYSILLTGLLIFRIEYFQKAKVNVSRERNMNMKTALIAVTIALLGAQMLQAQPRFNPPQGPPPARMQPPPPAPEEFPAMRPPAPPRAPQRPPPPRPWFQAAEREFHMAYGYGPGRPTAPQRPEPAAPGVEKPTAPRQTPVQTPPATGGAAGGTGNRQTPRTAPTR